MIDLPVVIIKVGHDIEYPIGDAMQHWLARTERIKDLIDMSFEGLETIVRSQIQLMCNMHSTLNIPESQQITFKMRFPKAKLLFILQSS